MYIERGKTNRGFEYVEFKDSYKNIVKIQESSKIIPHIWIFCDDYDGNNTDPHLNIEQAEILRDALDEFIKKYKNKETILD